MNTKKMTTEHLQATIEDLQYRAAYASYDHLATSIGINVAEQDYLSSCKKELARRWGIKP